MGQKGTHAEFLGQGKGLAIVMCGRPDLQRGLMAGDLPEQPQGPRPVPPLLMGTGEVEGTPSELHRLLHAASQQTGLAQQGVPECRIEDVDPLEVLRSVICSRSLRASASCPESA